MLDYSYTLFYTFQNDYFLESKDSSVVCKYGKLDIYSNLYITYIESKDRTKIKKYCIVAETLLDIEKYINSLTE